MIYTNSKIKQSNGLGVECQSHQQERRSRTRVPRGGNVLHPEGLPPRPWGAPGRVHLHKTVQGRPHPAEHKGPRPPLTEEENGSSPVFLCCGKGLGGDKVYSYVITKSRQKTELCSGLWPSCLPHASLKSPCFLGWG